MFISIEESMDEIDPDLVKATLNELLQNFREAERKRDEVIVKVETLQRMVGEMEEDRVTVAARMKDLHGDINTLKEQKRTFEDHYSSSQTTLTLKVNISFIIELFAIK